MVLWSVGKHGTEVTLVEQMGKAFPQRIVQVVLLRHLVGVAMTIRITVLMGTAGGAMVVAGHLSPSPSEP
jgi:hypothetical protein